MHGFPRAELLQPANAQLVLPNHFASSKSERQSFGTRDIVRSSQFACLCDFEVLESASENDQRVLAPPRKIERSACRCSRRLDHSHRVPGSRSLSTRRPFDMMVVSSTSTNGLFQRTDQSEQMESGRRLEGSSGWLRVVPILRALLRSAIGEAESYFVAMWSHRVSLVWISWIRSAS